MIGYPEPHHVYLADTAILAFTLFPQVQTRYPVGCGEVDAVYSTDIPLLYDIEFRAPFKEDSNGKTVRHMIDVDEDERYLAKNILFDNGIELCQQYLKDWCDRHGLQLK
jgi:hypothetical protein